MKLFDSIYSPAEDTYLLHGVVGEYLENKQNLKICEVGVGSGFILQSLLGEFPKNFYYGTDINDEAVERLSSYNVKKGNLLEPFNEKFDVIYFNTPYLPCEDGEEFEELSVKDKAIYGGKEGYEVIEEFILQLNDKLKDEGVVYMLFSTLSKKEYIDKLLKNNLFEFEVVGTESLVFEELLVYKIQKSSLLKRVSKYVESIREFSKGKHSRIFEGLNQGKKVMIKCGESQYIQKEVFFLKKLQGENFVSKLIASDRDFVIYEKIEGVIIEEFLCSAKKEELLRVFNNIFEMTYRLDKLGIQKFEMTNPYKHIFVLENLSVKMIDYERCIFKENPKNTRQFLMYIRKNIPRLENNNINISSEKISQIGKELKENLRRISIKEFLKNS